MGIEPTTRAVRVTGFEDQEGHQTPNASMRLLHDDVRVRRGLNFADVGRRQALDN